MSYYCIALLANTFSHYMMLPLNFQDNNDDV